MIYKGILLPLDDVSGKETEFSKDGKVLVNESINADGESTMERSDDQMEIDNESGNENETD